MGQCCVAEPVEEPLPVHKDVHSLIDDMQRYKRANSKERDLRVIKRRQDAKNKIEAYKERMKIRGPSRSLTPAVTTSEARDLQVTISGDDTGAVYGHESFHKNSEQRFNLFKESAGREVKRRSRQPEIKDEEEENEEGAGEGAEIVEEPKKAKKVKKGRRGRSKESEEERKSPQASVDREYEKKKKKKKKKHKEEELSEEAPPKKKKKKKKKDKSDTEM